MNKQTDQMKPISQTECDCVTGKIDLKHTTKEQLADVIKKLHEELTNAKYKAFLSETEIASMQTSVIKEGEVAVKADDIASIHADCVTALHKVRMQFNCHSSETDKREYLMDSIEILSNASAKAGKYLYTGEAKCVDVPLSKRI